MEPAHELVPARHYIKRSAGLGREHRDHHRVARPAVIRREYHAGALAKCRPERLDAHDLDSGHPPDLRQPWPEQGSKHRRPEPPAIGRHELIWLGDHDVLHRPLPPITIAPGPGPIKGGPLPLWHCAPGRLAPGAARIIGSGIGRVVAGYFALASVEMIPPGTMQWALGGVGYAALFSFPAAVLVGGPIGPIDAPSRSSVRGNPVEGEGRLDDQGGADRRWRTSERPVFGLGIAAGRKPRPGSIGENGFGRSDRSRLAPGDGTPDERGVKVRDAAQFGPGVDLGSGYEFPGMLVRPSALSTWY